MDWSYTNPETGQTEPVTWAETRFEHCERSDQEIIWDCHIDVRFTDQHGEVGITCETDDANEDKYRVSSLLAIGPDGDDVHEQHDGDGSLHGLLPENGTFWHETDCPVNTSEPVEATDNDDLAHVWQDFIVVHRNAEPGFGRELPTTTVSVDSANLGSECTDGGALGFYFFAGDTITICDQGIDRDGSVPAAEYAHFIHDAEFGNIRLDWATHGDDYAFGYNEGFMFYVQHFFGKDVNHSDHLEADDNGTDYPQFQKYVGEFYIDLADADTDEFDDVSVSHETFGDLLDTCSSDNDTPHGADHVAWCAENRIGDVYRDNYSPDHSKPGSYSESSPFDGSQAAQIRSLWLNVLYCDGTSQDGFDPGEDTACGEG